MDEIIKAYTKAIGREKRKDLMVIGFIVLIFILCLTFGILLAKMESKVLRERTAIDLNDGSVRPITMIDAIKAREMEAYHQSRYFMDNFFEFDKSNYETKLNRALWIGDNSVKAVYRDLLKNGWYNNVIDGNLRQYVEYKDNDILINFDKKPFKVVIKFEIILRGTNYEEEDHPGTVKFYLADCSMDMEHNPHGYEIQNLEIVDFK
jgi:hypothetical protein